MLWSNISVLIFFYFFEVRAIKISPFVRRNHNINNKCNKRIYKRCRIYYKFFCYDVILWNSNSIFFRHVKHHDVLIVTFNYGKKATKYVRDNDIGVVYSNETPISYNFFNINKFMKIRVRNMIYFASDGLVDFLNFLLGNKYEHLAYRKYSGYKIVEITEVISIDDKYDKVKYKTINALYETIIEKNSVKPGDTVVVFEENQRLCTGKVFDKPHICTTKELGFDDENNIYFVEDYAILGTDFFEMEEN